MYGSGRRRGLGMYGSGHRRGLGLYGSGRRFGLGATPTVDVTDFGSIVQALGLNVTPDQFGFSSWSELVSFVQQTGGITQTAYSLGGATSMFLSPSGVPMAGLVALVLVWAAFQKLSNGYLPTAAQVTSAIGVSGTPTNPSARPGNVPVSDYDWSQFAGAVLQYAPQVYQLFAAAVPDEVAPPPQQPLPPPTAQQAWLAALAQGAIGIPPDRGEQGGGTGPIQVPTGVTSVTGYGLIPTSAIVEGPTLLPDGTWYVVYHNDVTNPTPATLTWINWPGATYVPFKLQNVYIEPNQCPPAVPGTGAWYWDTAVNGNDPTNPCTGVPVGWTQGFGLVGPAAIQAVQQGYQSVGQSMPTKLGPPPSTSTTTPTGGPSARLQPSQLAPDQPPPPLYTAPVTVPSAPPASGATANGLAPIATNVDTAGQPFTPPVAPATVSVLYQPVPTVGPDTTTAAPTAAPTPTAGLSLSVVAALGAGVALLLSMQKAGRR